MHNKFAAMKKKMNLSKTNESWNEFKENHKFHTDKINFSKLLAIEMNVFNVTLD